MARRPRFKKVQVVTDRGRCLPSLRGWHGRGRSGMITLRAADGRGHGGGITASGRRCADRCACPGGGGGVDCAPDPHQRPPGRLGDRLHRLSRCGDADGVVAGVFAPVVVEGSPGRCGAASAVQVTAAADQFAQRMLDTWRQEATKRRISTPAPARVRWQWGPAEVTPPLVGGDRRAGDRHRPAPPARTERQPNPDPPGVLLEAGVVTRLYEELYYKLPHGRLVLLGGPGAGKTGAMILLLLAALEHRHSVPEAQRGEVPVPVWLTLGSWNPATQTLHQWAAATMYRDHPYLRAPDYGPDAAGELLRAGRVALFLDGLDEMAPSAQGKALARIEQEGAGLRIVLSSRPDEYRQVINEERLHNTAVIEVQPMDSDMARAYLLHDQIGLQHNRWSQLGDYLTHHPDSIAAHALNNPLTLSLARMTYQDQDPTPLIEPAKFTTVAALREHLIDRTLVTAYPDERQRAHATRWLAWIAHHLGSDRDLAWWHIPIWIPRWQLRLAVGLVGRAPGRARGRLMFGLAGGLPVGLFVGFGFGLAGGLSVGLPGGLAVGLGSRARGRARVGLVGGLAGGLACEVSERAADHFFPLATPP